MTVPVARPAARVLLVDAGGRLLLFRGSDPAAPEGGTWWITPGGGLEPGESRAQGAARELREESGLVVEPERLGEPVLDRAVEFSFDGVRYAQDEVFYLVRVDAHTVDTAGFTALEQRFVAEHRWWDREALRTTDERVFPEGLAQLLDRLAA